jgi:hypothetical protein
MIHRLVRWLLGIPPPDKVEQVARLAPERENARTEAVIEAGRSNLAGGKGAGPGGRDWNQWG